VRSDRGRGADAHPAPPGISAPSGWSRPEQQANSQQQANPQQEANPLAPCAGPWPQDVNAPTPALRSTVWPTVIPAERRTQRRALGTVCQPAMTAPERLSLRVFAGALLAAVQPLLLPLLLSPVRHLRVPTRPGSARHPGAAVRWRDGRRVRG
jgi:hypothetical protein